MKYKNEQVMENFGCFKEWDINPKKNSVFIDA